MVWLMAMLPMVGLPLDRWLGTSLSGWLQMLLSTPVVVWAGAPFFQRGWQSLRTRNLNMFTLIAIGTGTAYGYSLFALLWPNLLPEVLRHHGQVEVYFEAASVIIALVLLGQVLELHARRRTSHPRIAIARSAYRPSRARWPGTGSVARCRAAR
jgi:P-type Cu+ transporter